jgi:regulatory protein
MTSSSSFFLQRGSVPLRRPKQHYDENQLYDYAIGALARKMRSVAELKRLLRNRVSADESGKILVEMVILRLKEQKYLNDSGYAASYSAFRRDNEKFGARRVVTDLKLKGVHPEVIEKAVEQAYSGVDEEAQVRSFLKRKRLKQPANPREAAKVFRALLRAGFTSGIAVKVLKKWDVDDELLTALQEEGSTEADESAT